MNRTAAAPSHSRRIAAAYCRLPTGFSCQQQQQQEHAASITSIHDYGDVRLLKLTLLAVS
jgi:hypothetical protein